MKLNTQDRTIVRSGDFAERTFSIAASAKAFEILSAKLYTDIPRAIVRELSTNAFDAHMEAGHPDKPFDVHIPNAFEPYFKIRDYGTGLSPKQINEVYTTYFASTRSTSNEFVGALGLGSKSPFAYTDQFAVTSYYNGIAYSYSAFKNEHGEPSIVLLGEDETTESNGLEVSINVKPHDSNKFVIAARDVYRWFKTRPNVVGANLDIPESQILISGSGYELLKRSNLPNFVVVMGNVCYGVDYDQLRDIIKLSYNCTLVIFAEIGSCEITASREELHLDAKTIQYLKEKAEAALTDINNQILAKIINQNISLLEKHKLTREFPVNVRLPDLHYRKDGAYSVVIAGVSGYRTKKLHTYGGINLAHSKSTLIIEVDKAINRNLLKNYIIDNKYEDHVILLATIEDRKIFEQDYGKPDLKLSDIPAAVRSYSGPKAKPSYFKYIKSSIRPSTPLAYSWESSTSCTNIIAVPKDGNYCIFGGDKIRPGEALEIAKELGYDGVVGITAKRYTKTRNKTGLLDLAQEAKAFATKVANETTDVQWSITRHGTDSSIRHVISQINDASVLGDDIMDLAKVDPLGPVTRRLLMKFGLFKQDVPNVWDAFKQKYPLLNYISTYTNNFPINEVTQYIKLINNNVAV